MELNWLKLVMLLNWFHFGWGEFIDFCELPYCGTNNLACNNPSVSKKELSL